MMVSRDSLPLGMTMLDVFLNAAIQAATQAGSYLKSSFPKMHTIESKSHVNDLVTECDKTSEEMIKETLKRQFPHHGFYCEESGREDSQQDYTWIIDPLDGTVNFARKIPFFSVSIALLYNGKIQVGVVYCPFTEELFTAKKGQGAYLNQNKIAVSSVQTIKKSLGATGFPYVVENRVEACIKPIERLLIQGVGLRRLGSAAIDLAYLACGRFDLFFEVSLEAWDYAAAALLIEEAGGLITDYHNQPLPFTRSSSVMATNNRLHKAFIQEVLQ